MCISRMWLAPLASMNSRSMVLTETSCMFSPPLAQAARAQELDLAAIRTFPMTTACPSGSAPVS